MQAIGRRCGRPGLFTVRQGRNHIPLTPFRAFSSDDVIHQDKPPQKPQNDIPPIPDENYRNVPVDPETKTVKTAVGDLPISPLMDPTFHEARSKFTKPKPVRTEHKPTKFQRHLRRNPYALALATPVRRCGITNTVLPKFFLQPFNLMAHPETGEPWFVPTGLESKVPANAVSAEGSAAEAETEADEDVEAEEPSDSNEAQLPPKPIPPRGPSAYTLSYQPLFQEMLVPKSPYLKGWKSLGRRSEHGGNRLTPALNAAQWRLDMDSYILEVMRRRVVEGLTHFARLVVEDGREYVVKLGKWDDALRQRHRGCVLYLGPVDGRQSEEYVPPRLSKMDVPDVKFSRVLAVHNLRVILGEEHLARLREQSKLFREGSLFHLGRQATVKLQMMIWKLQGYMKEAEPGAPGTGEE